VRTSRSAPKEGFPMHVRHMSRTPPVGEPRGRPWAWVVAVLGLAWAGCGGPSPEPTPLPPDSSQGGEQPSVEGDGTGSDGECGGEGGGPCGEVEIGGEDPPLGSLAPTSPGEPEGVPA